MRTEERRGERRESWENGGRAASYNSPNTTKRHRGEESSSGEAQRGGESSSGEAQRRRKQQRGGTERRRKPQRGGTERRRKQQRGGQEAAAGRRLLTATNKKRHPRAAGNGEARGCHGFRPVPLLCRGGAGELYAGVPFVSGRSRCVF